MKHLADVITAARIAAAVIIWFFPPLSVCFFVFYTLGGVSDMADGIAARHTGSSGAFGAGLDSLADFIFFLSAALRLIPALRQLLPEVSARAAFAVWAFLAVVAVKAAAVVICAFRFRRLCFLHTCMSKLTGGAVFLLPFFYGAGCFAALADAALAIALLAAVEEALCMLKMKSFQPDVKGLFMLYRGRSG